jgi:hypothetical protein
MLHAHIAFRVLALSLVAGCGACSSAGAQAAPAESRAGKTPASEPFAIPESLRAQIRRNPESVLEQQLMLLYRYNPGGKVSAADVERFERVTIARNRVRKLTELLAYDLDGNGVISAKEISEAKPLAETRDKSALDFALVTYDTNKDGSLSYKELATGLDAGFSGRSRGGADNPLMFDLNGDNLVDAAELGTVIRLIAAEAPPETTRRPTERRREETCVLPPATAEAEIIALSVYEGDAVSTVAVSGQDRETSVVRVKIEPGKKPIYVFVTGYGSLVWNFEGATQRIERVVVQPGLAAGVAGISKSRVSFVPKDSCGEYASAANEGKAKLMTARLAAALNKEISGYIAAYRPNGIALPSGGQIFPETARASTGPTFVTDKGTFVIEDGQPVKIETRSADQLEQNLRRFYPAGILQLKAADVVSNRPVEDYVVLPQQAGLLQLVREGSLRLAEDGVYVIEKPIARFPAGLSGGHSVKFLLAAGVPMPAGSSGHSTVIKEAVDD